MDAVKFINGILLITALTTDSFVVSFAYGMEKTKMPFWIVAGMNLIMSSLLGTAVLAGEFLTPVLPQNLTAGAAVLLLAGMGIYRIVECFVKKNRTEVPKKYQELTGAEGFVLAFVLSLDSLAVGFGTGLVQSGELLLVAGSFVGGILMMEAGWKLGCSFCRTIGKDLSWISGICLLFLAFGILWK